MKLCYILVMVCCLAFSLSEKRHGHGDEEFVIETSLENSNDTRNNFLEINTLDISRKKKVTKLFRNCVDLKKQRKSTGIYLITPCDFSPTKVVEVYCDMETDGGGWTVIQRRDNYTQQKDFYNTWYEYAVGFGDTSKDFWLGNDNIHCLTQQSHHEIHFDLEDFEGNSTYAKYGFFYVEDRTNLYKLGVQDYSGNAGDSFSGHNSFNFSTFDADHDIHSSNCAESYKGGWWYSKCHGSNLNGLYLNGTHESYANGINWKEWKGYHYSLKKTEMKIRGRN